MTNVRKKKDGLLKIKMNEYEKEVITQVYNENKGNQVKTAKALGINRNTLRSRLVEYGLVFESAELTKEPEVVPVTNIAAAAPKPQPAVSFAK